MPNFGRLILPLIVITDQFAIISYLEQKPFLLFSPPPLSTRVSFDNKNKNLARLDSDWLIPTTPTSIRKYVAKILSQVREKRGASEKKNDFPSYVSWIYRFFFFLYFVVSMTIARSDRKRLRIFFLFYIFHLFMSHLHRQNAISTECL